MFTHIPRMCFGNFETDWISRDISRCLVVVASCTAQPDKMRTTSLRAGQFGVKQAARSRDHWTSGLMYVLGFFHRY